MEEFAYYKLDGKLIWQTNFPAPYESGWSIFAKILALNAMRPRKLKDLIKKPIQTTHYIEYWDSSWIDFDKLSYKLDVEQSRLLLGFLDQLGFHLTQVEPIKFCEECLRFGYHCIFFQLQYVMYCPWHGVELSARCYSCRDAVHQYGFSVYHLTENKVVRQSSCEHVIYIDCQTNLHDLITISQKSNIVESCSEFVLWLRRVSQSPAALEFLNNIHPINPKQINALYTQAVEYICGKSPWLINPRPYAIKIISWKLSRTASLFYEAETTFNRFSSTFKIYRAIRKHIYKRFVKSHLKCWRELKRSDYFGTQTLNSHKACTLALAYAAWRMAIENVINIEAFNSDELVNKPIKILISSLATTEVTDSEKAALLYAYFFSIWNDIQACAGKYRYSIVKDPNNSYADKIAVRYTDGRGYLIIPAPSLMEADSHLQCVGRSKPKNWMHSNNIQVIQSIMREYDGTSTKTMFRLELDVEGDDYDWIAI